MIKALKTHSPRFLRDLIVVGASAGGVTALIDLAKALPADLAAPVLVVQHVSPNAPSLLPELMGRHSALPVKHATSGEKLKPGVIYVAPPDHHLLVEDDHLLVTRGPKENRFRPSIDALFRSAAYTYGPRVIGVVLTGYLDDGTSGLWSVQRLGGVTVVQDPGDATVPYMPANALDYVAADYVVPLATLAALLTRLTTEPAPAQPRVPKAVQELLKLEFTIAKQDNAFELGIIDHGRPTPFTCPDCHGALTQLIEGKIIRFRCHTGHAYTVDSLLSEVTNSVESLLYQSMRGLEETKMILQQIGAHFTHEKQPAVAELFLSKAEQTGKQARVVHDSILKHQALSADLPLQARHKA